MRRGEFDSDAKSGQNQTVSRAAELLLPDAVGLAAMVEKSSDSDIHVRHRTAALAGANLMRNWPG